MAKSAQAFRTIREVADWLDVAAHVLRFWESKFSQIKPVKRAGGRRYYRPADMELVGGIKVLLHDRGLTIRGVQKMISEEGLEAVTSLSPPVDELVEADDAVEGEVIDGDATGAWKDDTAAEVLETPLGMALLGSGTDAPVSPQTPDVRDDAHPKDQTARTTNTPTPETPAAPEDVTAPETNSQDPSTQDASAPMPDLETTPSASPTPSNDLSEASSSASVAEQTPAEIPQPATASASPDADPAEGPLGVLTAIARLPAPKRTTLAPHIAALVRLRDRMSAPIDTR